MNGPAAGREERRRQVRKSFELRDVTVAQKYRERLAELYGKDRTAKIGYAEAFEITEYGSRPSPDELRRLFPFFEQ